MEPTKPQLPSEAIELYNDFIHEISRRAFMEDVQRAHQVRMEGRRQWRLGGEKTSDNQDDRKST